MFETVLGIVIDILLALAPNRRDHYVWYLAACVLVILSCSGCMLIIELISFSKR